MTLATDDNTQIGAIILAAGASRRMGQDKLLLNVRDRPMISHVIAAVQAAHLARPIVVVRPDDLALRAALSDFDVELVVVSDWALGMARSLRAGVLRCPVNWRACFICLGDMPFIAPEMLSAMAALANDSGVIVPMHKGRRGNPLLWGRAHFTALAAQEGDVGGRGLLTELAEVVVPFPWHDASIFVDFDTPDQLSTAM